MKKWGQTTFSYPNLKVVQLAPWFWTREARRRPGL